MTKAGLRLEGQRLEGLRQDGPRLGKLRLAVSDDIPALDDLIDRSARTLLLKDYTPAEIDGCRTDGIYGVDRQLIADKSYFAVVRDGHIVACGGWSFRKTLYGSDGRAGREADRLDPTIDAAKIRAFFVDPDVVGGGYGADILQAGEDAARKAGFSRTALMGTLTGARFYARHGYVALGREDIRLSNGEIATHIPMEKSLL